MEKSYYKSYYEENKEHIKNLVKKRYAVKKNEINKKMECDFCGRTIIARMYKKHCETNIHKKGRVFSIDITPAPIGILGRPSPLKVSPPLRKDGIITFR